MDLPNNTAIPFFAYGIFQPGELGFLRIRHCVTEAGINAQVAGGLRERDGVPVLDVRLNSERVNGALLQFRDAETAYNAIASLEPGHQYRWEEGPVFNCRLGSVANVLAGRSPEQGSRRLDENRWSGKGDPFFSTALELVDEALETNQSPHWDCRPLFRLEMAYMLLWSAIERYASLRHSLANDVTAKIRLISSEPAFQAELSRLDPDLDRVQRADEPRDGKTLTTDNPKKALDYYYQIRSNITHRGKAAMSDFGRLRRATEQMLSIFRCVLEAAWEEAKWPPP